MTPGDARALACAAVRLGGFPPALLAPVPPLVPPSWLGGAAVLADARARCWADASAALGRRLDELTAAVASAARRLLSVTDELARVHDETSRLLAQVTGGPFVLGADEQASLHRRVDALAQVAADLRRRADALGRELAETLARLDPRDLLPLVLPPVDLGLDVARAARTTRSFLHWLRAALTPTASPAARAAAARVFLAGRRALPVTAMTAARDVLDGGGHAGPAGLVTRLTAGAAALGAVALLVGVGPGTALAAAGAVTTYQVWQGGLGVAEAVRRDGGWLRRAWDGAGRLAGAAARRARALLLPPPMAVLRPLVTRQW